VAQPLFFVDPVDPNLRGEDKAFMLGESVLVIVDVFPNDTPSTPVSIPKNVKWYPLVLDNFTHSDLPQLKIRAGSIIVCQSPVEYVDQVPGNLSMIVALDDNNKAKGTYYDDNGDGYDYKNGIFLLTVYEAQVLGDKFTLNISEMGFYPRRSCPLIIRVLLKDKEVTYTTDNLLYQTKIEFNIN